MFAEAEEFALGLVSFSPRLAVFLIEPTIVAVTVRVMESVQPFASVPRLQVTVVVPPVQVPWLGVAETSASPAGTASVTVTPVELDGPVLVTVMVKVTFVLRATVGDAAVLVIANRGPSAWPGLMTMAEGSRPLLTLVIKGDALPARNLPLSIAAMASSSSRVKYSSAPSGVTASPLEKMPGVPGTTNEASCEKLFAVRSQLKACTTFCLVSNANNRLPTTRKFPTMRGVTPVRV